MSTDIADIVTVVNWNLELNGKNDPELRRAAQEKVKALKPDLLTRQEMWGADADGHTLFNDDKRALGLEGELGPDSCTAIFYTPRLFAPVRDWHQARGPKWVLAPTAMTLRYLPAGEDAAPFVAASRHDNYASATQRLIETEWLTTLADKAWQRPDGTWLTLPVLIAGDHNSYPEPGVAGDPPLPVLDEIKNRAHRVHRSYIGPDGKRHMDIRPDQTLRAENLMEDVARYWATAPHGSPKAVARTVNASLTHGPDARVDRAYVTPELLPAVTGVDVIEVDESLSDHHILRVTLDGQLLGGILRQAARDAPRD
ncbi:endonuclease/exonuclease/phosphatase family protein [Streptomyces chrestomyceticus]|uniref:endonuclease/exonuclease/phosphatase family protein n=1 Tax=Streptomyces chrestomyceticus TaxID=68185 RepID=UPI0033C82246